MVGIYLIVYGHIIPGGGFQGGAALAAVIISHFIIKPEKTFSTGQLKVAEKYIFVVLALVAVIYIITELFWDFQQFYFAYMVMMDVVLGIKVFCGLTIIFIEFAIQYQ